MNKFDRPKVEFTQITTIDKLLTEIKYLHRQYNEKLWFRGQADESWKLTPNVQRFGLSDEKERELTNDFRIRASCVMENAPDKNDYPSWMAHMQHHFLPTRMLDWTKSPLIAAFFALEEECEKDAAIWVLRPGKLNEIEIGKGLIYPLDSGTAARMLQTAFKEKEDKDKTDKDKEVEDKILACYSVQNDLRMYSQQSCFTIYNTKRKLTDMDSQDILFKYIIPRRVRDAFLDDLKIFGITRGFIYPDLDHIAQDMRINDLPQ